MRFALACRTDLIVIVRQKPLRCKRFFLVLISFRASGTSADAVAAIITPLGNAATATALKNKARYRYPVTGWI